MWVETRIPLPEKWMLEHLGTTLYIFGGGIIGCVLCCCVIGEVRRTLDVVVLGVGMSV